MSSLTVPIIGLMSILGALRLVKCRAQIGGSYGSLLEKATGVVGRRLVNVCIVLQQGGTCCSYFIVSCKLIQSTILPGTNTGTIITGIALIMAPLVAIRKVASLWFFSLLGTVIIVLGIFVVLTLEGIQVAEVAEADEMPKLPMINWDGLFVCLGQACFMFEGIGLVLPTYDSAEKPETFPKWYTVTLIFMLALVSSVGLCGFIAYGEDVRSLVLLNFPKGPVVWGLQLAFMIQVLCTFPLQMLPAVRLVEDNFFEYQSDPPLARKLAKSIFRAGFTGLLATIAYCGANKLDNFVSLIGAACGIPLAFVFPALCHSRIVESGCGVDRALMVGGTILMVCVVVVNLISFTT
eukprot:TRINITY_DN9713_c1_g4_i1.p1 TRINITY_DN9713_c1_g4~~TRINITY_DN9713_c1_g4_i1.p1  ORF type:complete len:393 (-),score=45.54 TRINITY_DN9713_c1_g4_i1:103-1152(-)